MIELEVPGQWQVSLSVYSKMEVLLLVLLMTRKPGHLFLGSQFWTLIPLLLSYSGADPQTRGAIVNALAYLRFPVKWSWQM